MAATPSRTAPPQIRASDRHLIPTENLVIYEERDSLIKREITQIAIERAIGQWLSGDTQPGAGTCRTCRYPVMRILRIDRGTEHEISACQCGVATTAIRPRH